MKGKKKRDDTYIPKVQTLCLTSMVQSSRARVLLFDSNDMVSIPCRHGVSDELEVEGNEEEREEMTTIFLHF